MSWRGDIIAPCRRAGIPAAIWLLLVGMGTSVAAQARAALVERGNQPASRSNGTPTILRDAGIDHHEGAAIPRELPFTDESGRDIVLGQYFGTRPVILAIVYYRCPMLCTMVLNDLTRTLNSLSETSGKEFDVIAVSFDPKETADLAAEKKRQYMRAYHRAGAEVGWHFLTGSQRSLSELCSVAGFRYAWDEKNHQWAHASGLIVLTSDGHICRYLDGIDYAPPDLRSAIAQAAARKIAPGEQARSVLYCFSYDPATGRYGLLVMRALRLGGIATVGLIIGSVWLTVKRDRRASAATAPVHARSRSEVLNLGESA